MTTIPGFEAHRIPAAGGVELHVAVGGAGRPIVLLHGFPQTHLMWRHVATALAGHDRGALVAFRAGLDHPDKITHLTCLDVLPTLDMWDVLRGTAAAVGF